MTLHEAIEKVLIREDRPLTAIEIAEEISRQKMYLRGDGSPVPASQVSARVSKYPHLFKVKGKNIQIADPIRKIELCATDIIGLFQKTSFSKPYKIAYDVLIPYLFFFKRAIDNENILENLGLKGIYENDKESFIGFLNDLDKGHSKFKGKLTDIIIASSQYVSEVIQASLAEIGKYHLGSGFVSINSFSWFYLRLLRKVMNIRFGRGVFMTPEPVAELIAGLAILKKVSSIYNPAAGTCSLPVRIARNTNEPFNFFGNENDPDSYLIALSNLVVNEIEVGGFEPYSSFALESAIEAPEGAIVCNPPFGDKSHETDRISRFPQSRELSTKYMQHIISLMDSFKRAVVVVPESFLFANDRYRRQLRNYIIEKNILEGVISLPSGMFHPDSGVKTSIVILDSNKRNEDVYFIDGEDPEFKHSTDDNKIILHTGKILKIANSYIEGKEVSRGTMLAGEPKASYGLKKFGSKNLNDIDSNLSVQRHLFYIEEPLVEENIPKVKLGEVFDILKGERYPLDLGVAIPYINIRDLNSDISQVDLNLPKVEDEEGRRGFIVDQDSILLGSIASSNKPTFFKYSGTPILLSPNIFALKFKKEYLADYNYEYFVYELGSKYVIEQLEGFASGTTIKRISKGDLKNILIRRPDPKEQLRILRERKEAIYSAKLNEAKKFAKEVGLNLGSQHDLIKFMDHEIGNIVGGIKNKVKLVTSFLKRKRIDISEPISTMPGALTTGDTMSQLENELGDIITLLENLQRIISLGKKEINLKEIDFVSFINEEVLKLNNILSEYNVHIGINENYSTSEKHTFQSDPEQFKILIRNFIQNTVKHGYEGEEADKNIVFHLSDKEEDYDVITLINDGRPFPEGFSFEDFIGFGEKYDKSKGSGLGGFLMNKIIENHNGTFELVQNPGVLYLQKDQKKGKSPDSILRPGVKFIIKIPKGTL